MPSFAPSLTMTSMPGMAAAPKPMFAGSDWDFSFHNLLGIVNPLQHLPVIGTLYRAITGDKIGTPEKIAGDALYGGLWGAVSSIADTAFEAATGKDFGDTMIGLVTGGNKSTAIAANSNTPASGAPDFGERLLALLNGDSDSMTQVADAAPSTAPVAAPPAASITSAPASSVVAAVQVPETPAPAPAAPSSADVVALTSALRQKGIDGDTAQRALMAYRRSQAPQNALLAVAQ